MSLMADPTACFNGDFFFEVGVRINRMLRIPDWRELFLSNTPTSLSHEKFDAVIQPFDSKTRRVSLRVNRIGEERYFVLSFYPNLERTPHIGLEELFPIFGYVEDPIPRDEIIRMLVELVIIPDNMLSERALETRWVDKNGGYHPIHTVETWQCLVASNMTRDGYWTWVYQALRMNGLEEEPLEA